MSYKPFKYWTKTVKMFEYSTVNKLFELVITWYAILP